MWWNNASNNVARHSQSKIEDLCLSSISVELIPQIRYHCSSFSRTTLIRPVPTTFAHFLLIYPGTLGLDDDKEGTAPCGGFNVNFTGDVKNVTVGAFAVALTSTHPQANWLYRFTTSTSEPFNWTDILPVVRQCGFGNFCLPSLSVPNSLVGKQGVIQVKQDAVDGSLYQVCCYHVLLK